jgi:hypothetical protein
MQLFRIIKESDKSYRLARKLPGNLAGDKNIWTMIKTVFNNPVEAEMHAHEIVNKENGSVIKEFTI